MLGGNGYMEINTSIENPQLVIAIQNYTSNQSFETERNLHLALKEAKFLAPVNLDGWQDRGFGEQKLNQDVGFNLISIQDENNNVYLPAFTDWGEVGKWSKDQDLKTMVFTLEDYSKIFIGSEESLSIVINPYGENLVINSQQVIAIGDNDLDENEIVRIGVPKKYPIEMCKAFENYFILNGCVSAAYLLLMVRNRNEQSYLLVIATDEDVDIIYPKLAEIADKYLQLGEVIDFISNKEEFGQSAIEGQEPFYEREEKK